MREIERRSRDEKRGREKKRGGVPPKSEARKYQEGKGWMQEKVKKKKQRLQLVSPKVSGIGPFVRVFGA